MSHPLQNYIEVLHERHRSCDEGAVADYIPELGVADPDLFAIAIATVDGQIYKVGDWNHLFSIQSISKPFVYGLAVEDRGVADVSKYVGVEPSGDAFNSISLDLDTGRPFNPMINAGAIVSTGLVLADNPAQRFDRIEKMFERMVGHDVQVDEKVYQSESATGFRNRAIAHLLRNTEMIQGPPEDVVEVYFKQCSILTSCRDLATMAGALAAGGICPATGQRAMSAQSVRDALSVMATCGMYDFAGEWVFRVGMPAKSGVAGGIIGVLPGQFGVAVFSPRVDPKGNSVRGIRVFNDLAAMLNLHMFNLPSQPRAFVRARYDASRVRSKRLRPANQEDILSKHAHIIGIWELQDFLSVCGVEVVVRDLLDNLGNMRFVVIDLRRITGIDDSAAEMLAKFVASAHARDLRVVLTHLDRHQALRDSIHEVCTTSDVHPPLAKTDRDAGIEWCEEQLLAEMAAKQANRRPGIEQFDLLQSMSQSQLATLSVAMASGEAEEGDVIVTEGDVADSVYFLLEGKVSVTIAGPDGKQLRVATCSPVMTFGEMALLDQRRRSASVRADSPLRYLVLTLDAFAGLQRDHPDIAIKLIENLARGLSEKLRRANEEISALSG